MASAASKHAELEAVAAAATGPRLLLPAELVGQLGAGAYSLRLTVTNWLGTTGARGTAGLGGSLGWAGLLGPCLCVFCRAPPHPHSPATPLPFHTLAAAATLAFDKVATALPQLAIVGGPSQAFSVSAGIRVQTAIDLGTVCPGKCGMQAGGWGWLANPQTCFKLFHWNRARAPAPAPHNPPAGPPPARAPRLQARG